MGSRAAAGAAAGHLAAGAALGPTSHGPPVLLARVVGQVGMGSEEATWRVDAGTDDTLRYGQTAIQTCTETSGRFEALGKGL